MVNPWSMGTGVGRVGSATRMEVHGLTRATATLRPARSNPKRTGSTLNTKMKRYIDR